MGENGAGKSTLIKVLTGLYPRDSGEILYNGKPFQLSSPVDAPKHGISTMYQEINLISGFIGRRKHLFRAATDAFWSDSLESDE